MATVSSNETATEPDERTRPPFLRRVRIRGYKSIGFCDVALQPLTILVGRNAAGKSNFLGALAFLRDVVEFNATVAVERHGGWSSLLCRSVKSSTIEIEIEAVFSGGPWRPSQSGGFVAKYLLQVTGGTKTFGVSREKLEILDETEKTIGGFDLRRSSTGSRIRNFGWPSISQEDTETILPHRADQTFLGVLGLPPFLHLADSIRRMGYYNFHPDSIRQLQKSVPGTFLKKDGSNLASVFEGMKQAEMESLLRVKDYLATVVESIENFNSVSYGEYETVRFDLRHRTDGLAFDAASMSDGTLRALAALMAAFQIVPPHIHPSVVGIEEPETALHPAAMRALVDALDEATQHTQVILTTHSADLLSGRDIAPGQVLVVRNQDGQTQITPIDSASREIIDKELYSLADLQRMDKLDLDEADLKRQDELSRQKEA